MKIFFLKVHVMHYSPLFELAVKISVNSKMKRLIVEIRASAHSFIPLFIGVQEIGPLGKVWLEYSLDGDHLINVFGRPPT